MALTATATKLPHGGHQPASVEGIVALGYIANFILVVCFGFLAATYKAFVLQHLWAWFITPTFDVDVPSVAVLIGLFYCVALFLSSLDKAKSKHGVWASLFYNITIASIFWGLGWLVYTYASFFNGIFPAP